MKTENVELQFTDDGIEELAEISSQINSTIENIGARRLHTILEKVDRKSTRLNSSHGYTSYAVLCLKKKTEYLAGSGNKRNNRIMPIFVVYKEVSRGDKKVVENNNG